MSVHKKIDEYTRIIWEDQLPSEEQQFLHALINREKTSNFHYDMDSDYSLFLAYNASRCGFKGYNDEQIADFHRILQFYKKQKIIKVSAMSKIFRIFNENDIVPLLVKGAAFLCYYAPDIPRMMGDIDIFVNPSQYDKALALLYENGFSFIDDTGYHISLESKELDIDLHRHIYKNGGDINADIYDRLITCSFLGCKVAVLAPEDMLVHQLANRGDDIYLLSHRKRHFKWIIDCLYILQFCNPDMDTVLKKAASLHNEYSTRLTLLKLTELFPDKFGKHTISANDDNYCRFLKCVAEEIKIATKYEGKTVKGLEYIVGTCFMKWEKAKIAKISVESKEPIIKVLLEQEKVNTISGITKKKKTISKKINGAELV